MPIVLGEPFSLDQRLAEQWNGGEIDSEAATKVAILGAGLAGLTCALRLSQGAGRPVTRDDFIVLEREPKAGGRARSVRIGSAVLDLGALTFQPKHYPRYSALLEELGISDKVREVPRRQMIFGCDGRATRADNLSLAWDGAKGLVGRGVFTPWQAAHLLRFYAFLKRVTGQGREAELMALHELSIAEWAGRFGFDLELQQKFVEPFTHYCFRPPDEVSAAFGVFLLGFNLGRPATLAGGFGQVTDALAERLSGLIETEAVALDVRREPGGFGIVYSYRGRPRQVHARALVVALPASVAARVVPEMRERAASVEYGSGHATILAGRLKAGADLHLRRISGPAGSIIYGGEIRAAGRAGHLLNLLTYRGEGALAQARKLFVGEKTEQLAEYTISPAAPAPKPGQTPLPVEWGDGLFMAGDCVGLFPSQETAVSSGEEAARLVNHG